MSPFFILSFGSFGAILADTSQTGKILIIIGIHAKA
jgi:hypothetical protein